MSVTIRIRSIAWFAGGVIVTMVVMLMFLDALRVDAAPGDLDSTLVPVTPCGLVNPGCPVSCHWGESGSNLRRSRHPRSCTWVAMHDPR